MTKVNNMPYFLDKAFSINKPKKNITLSLVYYGGRYTTFTKAFKFKNNEAGEAKCKATLFKFLTLAYMDLDCEADGKYENDKGKRVFIKPEDVTESYDYEMVWDELWRDGTTEGISMGDADLDIYLS